MQKKVIIAASILTADFLNLQKELDRIIQAKIRAIHFDVMDNHFVPNLSFGPKILADVCNYVKDKNVVVDCHLMVKIEKSRNIKDYLQPFLIPGVNSITLHYEALSKEQLHDFLNWNNNKFKKGLAISPDTPIQTIEKYLSQLDFILIMSVYPGFGNQTFITNTLDKIKEVVRQINIKNINNNLTIAVDGGVNSLTADPCIKAGANYLVSGSYLLNSPNSIEEQMKQMLINYE